MKRDISAVNYRDFRLRKINDPRFCHLWYFLFWPVYLTRYFILEKADLASMYRPVHCVLDDRIPFHEIFVIPYVLWYLAFAGMHIYTAFYDVDTFRRYSRFLCISMGLSTIILIAYPSCQNLRPDTFLRRNILTKAVSLLYTLDTNTNVYPSEHAIGAIGIFLAALHTEKLRNLIIRAAIGAFAVLVCAATVFLKQHSVLDVVAAFPVCAAAYWISYRKPA